MIAGAARCNVRARRPASTRVRCSNVPSSIRWAASPSTAPTLATPAMPPRCSPNMSPRSSPGALSSPRARTAGWPSRPARPGGWRGAAGRARAAVRRSGVGDERSRARRLADGLVELAMHSLDHGFTTQKGATRTHLQLTASVETVKGLAGAPGGDLEFAGAVPAATVQRLACDASIRRVLLGPDSAVIDVGRRAAGAVGAGRARCGCATRDASGRAATGPPRGPMPTTSCSGVTAGSPTSRTWCCSAIDITGTRMRVAGRWSRARTDGCSRPPPSFPYRSYGEAARTRAPDTPVPF